ncbi:HNH endonuclease [Gordonia sp. L191]|uniref:HNH endonuclease n=1 Tax=Gordonia sp. L191 TaxID=2982699 RepID=UPI0024C0BCA3|nr:HNH endonuclease [Gordonia sp. L191]WHU47069.1 HNH endonuclease [Gordonia sp. L191]
MNPIDARYSNTSSDHNRLLLLALTEAWGSKCYWCRTPKLFRELQIDHIVPRRPREAATTVFDLDAVENLAPICGPCNQEKANEVYQHAPRVESQLKRARSRAETVQRNLDRFRRDTHITKVLLAITAADVADEAAAGAIKALGRVVLNVLRSRFPDLLDASYVEDYTTHHPPIEYEGRTYQRTDGVSVVELDGRSRRVAVVLEDVFGLSLRYALDTVREEVRGDIDGCADVITTTSTYA